MSPTTSLQNHRRQQNPRVSSNPPRKRLRLQEKQAAVQQRAARGRRQARSSQRPALKQYHCHQENDRGQPTASPSVSWASNVPRNNLPRDIFDYLNPDCCNIILAFLSPVDLIKCERVCRSWRDHVQLWMDRFGIQLHFPSSCDGQNWVPKNLLRHLAFKLLGK